MEADNEGVDDDSQQQQQQQEVAVMLPQQHTYSSGDAAGSSSSVSVRGLAAADAAAVDLSGVELQLLGSSAESVGCRSMPCQLPQGAENSSQQHAVDSCNLQQKQQLAATEATNTPEGAAAAEAEAALADQASVASTSSIEAAVELRVCPKGCSADKTAGSKLAAADEHAAASVAAAAVACDEAAAAAPAAAEDEWATANRQRLAELQQQVSCIGGCWPEYLAHWC
jgi:hypothetical protein